MAGSNSNPLSPSREEQLLYFDALSEELRFLVEKGDAEAADRLAAFLSRLLRPGLNNHHMGALRSVVWRSLKARRRPLDIRVLMARPSVVPDRSGFIRPGGEA